MARGVSLLEMVVALTILAVAGAALFGWVYRISAQIQRLNAQQTQSFAQLRAIHFLQSVNPAMSPSGRQQFTEFMLVWEALPITPLKPALNPGDAPQPTSVAAYDVQASLTQGSESKPWLVFNTRLIGWINPADQAQANDGSLGSPGLPSGPGIPGIAGRSAP